MDGETPQSISWIMAEARRGEPWAENELLERVTPILVALATNRMRELGVVPREYAPEDAANSVAFRLSDALRNARLGKFHDRTDLARVLAGFMRDKIIDRYRYQLAQIRGEGRVRGESELCTSGNESSFALSKQADAASLSPDEELGFHDDMDMLFRAIERQVSDRGQMRTCAMLHLQGQTNKEIASQLKEQFGVGSESTVERKLRTIRQLWAEEWLQRYPEFAQ